MSGSMANYSFGDTPSTDANKLQWHKIQDGNKTLLICDRVVLVSVSWDDLNGQGYVTGKTVTIDGAKYKCRILTGGSHCPYRSADDRFVTVGFRSVLEVLNTDPLISDSNRDLEDKNSNFTIEYTVDDADSGDVLTATESIDGQTTSSFAPTRNSINM